MLPIFKTKLISKVQKDLCKSRSQSSPNCLIVYETDEATDSNLNEVDQLIDDVDSVDSSQTVSAETINVQRFQSPYDLRRKNSSRASKDDNQIVESLPDQTTRSTNSSPNLNQTQRKKQRKCNSCSINHNHLKFENSNNLFLNLENGDDFLSRLPDEILLKIFSYLDELDLCNVSGVSKKFYKISNDCELWKRLYHQLYEYDLPIVRDENSKFAFINPSDDHLDSPNVWKASFTQFYRSVHIRKESAECNSIANEILKIKLGNLFSNVKASKIDDDKVPVIFIHKGTYKQESLMIEVDVNLIGAAPGPVDQIAKQVVIENSEQSTIHFTGGVKHSYLGYVSLIFRPDETSANHHHPALKIDGRAKPKIFNCIIRSTCDVGATVCVFGESTEPTIKNCQICECHNVGIFVDSYARGFYENNLIAKNTLAGVWVKNMADPVFKKNIIKEGLDVGVFCFDNSLGWFEQNDIHSNRIAGFEGKFEHLFKLGMHLD